MRRLPVLIATALMALTVRADAAAPHSCENTYGGDVISAQNMSCHKAKVVVRAWAHKFRRDNVVDRRARGFDCRGSNSSVEGLVMRCSSDGRRVTFYANVP